MVTWAAHGNTENPAGMMEVENQQLSFKNQLRMEMAKYLVTVCLFPLSFLLTCLIAERHFLLILNESEDNFELPLNSLPSRPPIFTVDRPFNIKFYTRFKILIN